MPQFRKLTRSVRLGYLLMVFLVAFGSLPLVINAASSLLRNQGVLARQEQEKLARTAELLRVRTEHQFDTMAIQLEQAAVGLRSLPLDLAPGANQADRSTQLAWADSYLEEFQKSATDQFAVRVVDLIQGRAQSKSKVPEIQQAMDDTLELVREDPSQRVSRLIVREDGGSPLIVITQPVLRSGSSELGWVIQGVSEIPLGGKNQGDVFVIDLAREGEVLWSSGSNAVPVRRAVQQSAVVRAMLDLPKEHDIIPVLDYALRVGADSEQMIGQAVRLGGTDWAILVQQPKSTAFLEIRNLMKESLWSVGIMVGLALLFATIATRLLTGPLEKLAATTQAIAHGQFGHEIEEVGFGSEMAALAESFNTMSGQIAAHVDQLRHAANINRELFIGSIRSFLAAIEAKEPYTRGHSERVASYSQSIARHLNLSREFQERIWIAGLMHDVGKIGIDDRVLKKGDKLTDEEYEEMKRHAAIGAEIMSSIEQLKDMLPAIRWHHEDWAGTGYPDGLKGEEIPLMARIVGVADTFDAITTQRVYQDPFTREQALDLMRKLTGKRFDPRVAAAFFEAIKARDIDPPLVSETATTQIMPSRKPASATPVPSSHLSSTPAPATPSRSTTAPENSLGATAQAHSPQTAQSVTPQTVTPQTVAPQSLTPQSLTPQSVKPQTSRSQTLSATSPPPAVVRPAQPTAEATPPVAVSSQPSVTDTIAQPVLSQSATVVGPDATPEPTRSQVPKQTAKALAALEPEPPAESGIVSQRRAMPAIVSPEPPGEFLRVDETVAPPVVEPSPVRSPPASSRAQQQPPAAHIPPPPRPLNEAPQRRVETRGEEGHESSDSDDRSKRSAAAEVISS